MAALLKKDLMDYFYSPLVYLLGAVFLLVMGWFFFNFLMVANRDSSTDFFSEIFPQLFGNMTFLLLILTPFVTMGSFASEQQNKTLDLLWLSGLKKYQLVVAKMLSCLGVMVFLVALTIIFPVFLAFCGYSDWGKVFTCYSGILFCAIGYSILGVFCSALAPRPLMAAILTFAFLFSFLLLALSASAISNPMVGQIFTYLSIAFHFTNFARGVIASYNLVYFLSFIFFFFFLAMKALELKKWQ